MNRRMGGIEEFEFDVLTDGSQLNLTIAITGWLLEDTGRWRHQLLPADACVQRKNIPPIGLFRLVFGAREI